VLYGIDQMVPVEVLNGTGRPGLAARAADVLQKQGFSVVHVGNVEGSHPRTVIQVRGADEREAQAVAAALSGLVRRPALGRAPDSADGQGVARVTVILGDDVMARGSEP
jgi:mRNA-degrading endonuclease toxin of MazEF toxin-antitoxin module